MTMSLSKPLTVPLSEVPMNQMFRYLGCDYIKTSREGLHIKAVNADNYTVTTLYFDDVVQPLQHGDGSFMQP